MVFIRLLRFSGQFALDFLAVTDLLEHVEACRKELKPFLANLGTRVRA
jgi:hypothetical protein